MPKNKHSPKKDKTYDNQINYKKDDLLMAQNLIVSILNNFFEKNDNHQDFFGNKLSEKRELEQYF